MKIWLRNPIALFCMVLVWRVLLLIFTAQPIPANDAFGYDGPVINYLHGGRYCNPSLALIFPISGTEVYAMYPPLYQGVLLAWMTLFGTSVLSAMALHLFLFAISGILILKILKDFFPRTAATVSVVWLLFGFTFVDRPESLAYVFGLASLWLVARQLTAREFSFATATGLAIALLAGLYTSVIVGAYFFGAGLIACAIVFLSRPHLRWFAPFIGAGLGFAAITAAIVKLEPRWWAGFQESVRQQTVSFIGFHAPNGADAVRLLRTAPVFVAAFLLLPGLIKRRREIFNGAAAWPALTIGIFIMGWILLAGALTLLASSYVNFVILTQIILAAGLLAMAGQYFAARKRFVRVALVACAAVVSIRAVGISTWGVACMWKNSYFKTQNVLRQELAPFTVSSQPVLLSSAFLYSAADQGVKNAIHCDWFFDHSHWTNNAEIDSLARLQPRKLILTQFDYYRGFAGVLGTLEDHPELAGVHIKNLALVPAPDSIFWFSRVVQHVSWAPVIVDLEWKRSAANSNSPLPHMGPTSF